MNKLPQSLEKLDRRAHEFLHAWSIPVLRVCLGVVFLWFGLLKLLGRSPVADLVIASAPPLLPPDLLVKSIGAWEVLVGLGLLSSIALRVTLLLFWLQMAGTFLVLVQRPDIAFQQGNPLLLTKEGEFVIKNLVLVSAGLVVGMSARHQRLGKSS